MFGSIFFIGFMCLLHVYFQLFCPSKTGFKILLYFYRSILLHYPYDAIQVRNKDSFTEIFSEAIFVPYLNRIVRIM